METLYRIVCCSDGQVVMETARLRDIADIFDALNCTYPGEYRLEWY